MAAAPRSAYPPPVALYVHFPFCLSVCPYCDFVVYAGRAARGPDSRVASFVDALVTEIKLRARRASLASVYLGGGTPSLMSAAQIGRLLEAVDRSFGIAAEAEVTMEVNPGRSERGDLAEVRAAGVNRLSIGAQSFDAAELRTLGRRHSPTDIAGTFTAARRAGFDNVSLDLLYDVPGQTIDSWRHTLDAALAVRPDHVSAYALTLDDAAAGDATPGIPPNPTSDHLPPRAGALHWREKARIGQDEERAADCFELADELFEAAGLVWYELSNWARPGAESRHNLCYWLSMPWEAVGPGAHAYDGVRTRRWNAARLDGYLEALLPTDRSGARLPPGGSETTDEQTAVAEAAILRLRTSDGLPADVASNPEFTAALAWARANLLTERSASGGVRLTRRGRLLANEVFLRLLPAAAGAAAA